MKKSIPSRVSIIPVLAIFLAETAIAEAQANVSFKILSAIYLFKRRYN